MPKIRELGVSKERAYLKATIETLSNCYNKNKNELSNVLGLDVRTVYRRLDDVGSFTVSELEKIFSHYGYKLVLEVKPKE